MATTKERKALLAKNKTVLLVDLPGVKRKATQAIAVTSATRAMTFIRHGLPVAAAGDDGSITVWKDDDGLWRCEFARYMRTVDSPSFNTIAAVGHWLRDWWPKMRRE